MWQEARLSCPTSSSSRSSSCFLATAKARSECALVSATSGGPLVGVGFFLVFFAEVLTWVLLGPVVGGSGSSVVQPCNPTLALGAELCTLNVNWSPFWSGSLTQPCSAAEAGCVSPSIGASATCEVGDEASCRASSRRRRACALRRCSGPSSSSELELSMNEQSTAEPVLASSPGLAALSCRLVPGLLAELVHCRWWPSSANDSAPVAGNSSFQRSLQCSTVLLKGCLTHVSRAAKGLRPRHSPSGSQSCP